uniref:Uncharacterized protein n=1 Tax=viral metagenome TaxID=1070528 RepID=A0A6C0BLM7_9ZZZZ
MIRHWASTCGDVDILLEQKDQQLCLRLNDFLLGNSYFLILFDGHTWSLDHTIFNTVAALYEALIHGLNEDDRRINLRLISEEARIPPKFDIMIQYHDHKNHEDDTIMLTLNLDTSITLPGLESGIHVSLDHIFLKAISIENDDRQLPLDLCALQMT